MLGDADDAFRVAGWIVGGVGGLCIFVEVRFPKQQHCDSVYEFGVVGLRLCVCVCVCVRIYFGLYTQHTCTYI